MYSLRWVRIGTFRMPEGIGQIAEDILRGCLQREYMQRWNISQVDENAWGVGWGDHPCSVRVLSVYLASCTFRGARWSVDVWISFHSFLTHFTLFRLPDQMQLGARRNVIVGDRQLCH